MELIDKCYTLNPEQQNRYANREVKKIAIVFGSVSVGMIVLLLSIKAPAFLLKAIIPAFLGIFALILVIRYFAVKQMALGYQLCFDEDGIWTTFDQEKVGNVVTGMSSVSEARYGSKMNQGMVWRNIDSITINSNGIKIFSKNYDVMNGNGKVEIPVFMDDYKEIKAFFEEKYRSKINK